MLRTLLFIPLLEIIGLAGFAYVASTNESNLRALPVFLAAAAIIWLAVDSGNLLVRRRLLVSSVVVSLVFVGLFQVLGLIFHGFAKDIEVFSIANTLRLAAIFLIAVVCHLVLFAVANTLRRRSQRTRP